jgi:hypothetical protein
VGKATRSSRARLRSVTDATFRASRAFRLGSANSRRSRRSDDSPYVGILTPIADRWLGARAADSLAAELFRSVRTPRRISPALLRALGRDRNRVLATFVLDGVLEIEGGDGFVTGADAHREIVARSTTRRARSTTSDLSISALRYASVLPIDDADELSARLYFFNRRPITPAWRTRLPDASAVERFLRVGIGSRTRAILDKVWERHDGPPEVDGWAAWSPRETRPNLGAKSDTFKVFISPEPQQAADAVEVVVDTLVTTGPAPLKIPAGLYSLMRPDKIVVYFTTRAGMRAFIRSLRPRLDELRAHGVPFSADVTGNGLVSWGLDPADGSLPFSNTNTQSWRVTITSRLARSLILARHAVAQRVDPVQFALDRLSLDPVDVATWAPRPG